jgi:hypothetical protein
MAISSVNAPSVGAFEELSGSPRWVWPLALLECASASTATTWARAESERRGQHAEMGRSDLAQRHQRPRGAETPAQLGHRGDTRESLGEDSDHGDQDRGDERHPPRRPPLGGHARDGGLRLSRTEPLRSLREARGSLDRSRGLLDLVERARKPARERSRAAG